MGTQPLVSVVTACYKHERYVDDYFNGLLRQTYDNVELVFVDDGSPDGTWEKAKQYEGRLRDKFAKVHMVTQPNQGAHRTILRGLSLVTGELLCFLESDDYYYPTKIEKNVDFLRSYPEVGVVHSDLDYVLPDRIERAWKATYGRPIPTGDVRYELLRRNFIDGPTACFRRELLVKYGRLEEYAARGYKAGDWPLWLDLAPHCHFGYIPESLACYRILQHSASQRGDPEKRFSYYRALVMMQWDFIREVGWSNVPADVREDVRKKILAMCYWLRESNSARQAGRLLWRLMRETGADGAWAREFLKLWPRSLWRRLATLPAQYPE